MDAYKDFTEFTDRLKLLATKHPDLITTTLSNIFTMRLIGNKTHGDLAEIAITEFINQFMYDFKAEHVGKDLYRAKEHEEDIKIINEITKAKFPVSLKAYGVGPLQISTDKTAKMYEGLQAGSKEIADEQGIATCWDALVACDLKKKGILALIYNEKAFKCNMLVFNEKKAKASVVRISKITEGGRRKHPVYRFFDMAGVWICEVRYGSATANALQRGLWTHTTKSGLAYFDSITNGWIDYAHNLFLVKLFSHALVCSSAGHESALDKIKEDIVRLKQKAGLRK